MRCPVILALDDNAVQPGVPNLKNLSIQDEEGVQYAQEYNPENPEIVSPEANFDAQIDDFEAALKN